MQADHPATWTSPSPRLLQRSCPAGPDWPGVSPLIQRLLRSRGIGSVEDIDLRLGGLRAGSDLPDIDPAAGRIAAAIEAQEPILVVGDFDADGATGTALAVRGLRLLGARSVEFAVPDRMRHGYGLSDTLVAELLARRPALLITVDQGTSSLSGIASARAAGIDVVVTDHHLPGSELPAASALVNPNLRSGHPLAGLAGVGVVFHLLAAVRALLQLRGKLAQPVQLAALLDLVALGTVADLVPLDRHNRILVTEGLRRIRAGRACAGVHALLASAGRDHRQLRAGDLGFQLAPRLNAAGRLDDMGLGIRCLLSDDPAEASELAQRLNDLNHERRSLQADMEQGATAIVERLLRERAGMAPAGLVVADPDWHPGIVGLVASRLAERLHRPTLALAPAADGEWRGSGRSVPGFHLRDALVELDRRHPGLMARFGGHAAAAGLSTRGEALDALAQGFDEVTDSLLAEESRSRTLWTDGALSAQECTLDSARAIEKAGPYGQAFPEPLFDNPFRVLDRRVLKQRHLKLRLAHPDGGPALEAIWFATPPDLLAHTPAELRLQYQLTVHHWQGLESLQLVVRSAFGT